jgi:CHAD domain-containing protein
MRDVDEVKVLEPVSHPRVASFPKPPRALQAADNGPLEIELIVEVLSAQYAVATGRRRLIRRTRLDTFDHRLDAAGLTLEHQIVASGERLVLGRLDGSSTVAAPVTDLRWPALADSLPQCSLRDAVAAVTGIRALLVVSDEKRRVQRLELHNKNGKTVARVELDGPSSAAGPPAEVWVRSLLGYDEQARRAARLLTGAGLLAVEHSVDTLAGTVPPTAPGDRDAAAAALLTGVLNDFLATMRENLPGLLDDVDTEFLHDFRVAVRRTRATLKLGRPALPAVVRGRWEPDFKWLGDLTTPVRDLDVYQLNLPTMAGWLVSANPADLNPFELHLRSRRTSEHRVLVRALRSARFRRLVTQWEEELARLGDTSDDADREHLSAGRLADRAISLAYGRVARGGAAIGADSPAVDLHQVRKRCKELRYALEVFAPVSDEVARKRAVADLKGLQDVLGRFQDSEVQRQALRGFAEEMLAEGTPAGAVLAMGELIGHLDAEQDRARREFDVAFARFARPSSLQLMHRLGGRQ